MFILIIFIRILSCKNALEKEGTPNNWIIIKREIREREK